MMPGRTIGGLALAACLLHASTAIAQAPVVDPRDLDERLRRIEKLIGTESLFKLFEEVESLGAETRELRGQLEEISHSIRTLEQRQRELYLDIDQRMQRLESAPPVQTAAPSTQSPTPSEAPEASFQPAAGTTTSEAAAAPAAEPAAAPAATPAPEIDPFAEQQAYQRALDILKSGRYADAAAAFREFTASYPAGKYADNAQYWLGETHYVTREYPLAIEEYQRLISNYPESQKLTGALLKIGYSHYELGNMPEAERVLNDLVERHPQSAAAGLARKRLQSIRQQ